MMSLTVRQERMRLLALASVERLEAGLSAVTPPDYEVVRGPETGLVMILSLIHISEPTRH